MTRVKPRRWFLACGLAIALFAAIVGCNLNAGLGPGGVFVSFEILGKSFTFSLSSAGAMIVTADVPTEVPVGIRLFDEPPATVPPSGVMRLPSASVGVAQRLAKGDVQAKGLPLIGSGKIRFNIASGQSATLCSSAILLAEYDLAYNAGVAAILNEEYELSQEALAIIATSDVTMCIQLTLDFDAEITLGEFTFTFGGSSGSQSATFVLSNDDSFENIHILMPGESFNPATNRLTPGASRTVNLDVDTGDIVNVRAGRNGVVLDNTDCPEVTGEDYQASVSWNGVSLDCTATQGDGAPDDTPVPPGTIIQVPVDNPGGIATVAPVTSTYSGVDYGVVGVLYDETPETGFAPSEPNTMSVDLSELGLESVSTIYMALHSSFVADLPNGVDMGTLTVNYAEGGSPTTLDFVLGVNTAEWSYDRPENVPVPHSLVPTLYTFPSSIDSASEYLGREYALSFSPDSSRTISCMTLDIAPGATYAAFRDAGSPTATWASQYIGAMTLEGPAGTPPIVGDCSGISIPVPDCDDDGVCDPLCGAGEDPDCTAACAADGECNPSCTIADPDPDCPEICVADGECNTNCSDLEPDPDCPTDPGTEPKCTARSDFESGDDGWTLIGDAEGGRAEPDYIIAGGNPGGHISADDDVAGGVWLFQAPAEFRGDFSAAYGRALTFELKQSSLSSQFNERDVILIGGGMTIWFDTAMNPGLDWTAYSVTLDDAAGWMRDDDTPASEADIRAVLADLEDLQIRGEYVVGADTGGLDNVVLNSDCP